MGSPFPAQYCNGKMAQVQSQPEVLGFLEMKNLNSIKSSLSLVSVSVKHKICLVAK